MCAVIIAEKVHCQWKNEQVSMQWHTRRHDDLDMPNIDNEKLWDGHDKVFPYGTTITFRGKYVPCYVTST
jgi:hypothetical protein